MIQATLTGNIGRDATLKALDGGKNVINFTVAVSIGYKDKQKTLWVECSYFTERTGITPYLLKGTKVLVIGQPDIRSYQKQDGSTGVSMTVIVREVELLGGNKSQEATNTTAAPTTEQWQAPANAHVEEPTDLPF